MAILGALVFGAVPGIGAVPRIEAVPRIGADVGEGEEEAGVALDAEGVEDIVNIDTFYCCWGVSNFARVTTLYFVRNSLGFSVLAGVCL